MKKRTLSILLTLCMVLSLMPAMGVTANAAAPTSPTRERALDLNSAIRVGSDETNYLESEGWAWYATPGYHQEGGIGTNAPNTLVLRNAYIQSMDSDAAINIPYTISNPTIQVIGDCKVESASESGLEGILCGGNLIITGSEGTLEVVSTANTPVPRSAIGVSGSLAIEAGVTVNCRGNNAGISAGGLDISGNVTATGGDYGIYSGAGVTINAGATVTASGTKEGTGIGIYCDYNSVSIRGTVNATGAVTGISGKPKIFLRDGNTTASGGTQALLATEAIVPATGVRVYAGDTEPGTKTPYAGQKWVNAFLPKAALTSVTVAGSQGVALTSGVPVTITLTNEKFKAVSAGTVDWIQDLPTGLTQTIAAISADAAAATITVGGTPSVTSTDTISVIIPAAALQTGEALTSTANSSAKYNIVQPPAVFGNGLGNNACAFDDYVKGQTYGDYVFKG